MIINYIKMLLKVILISWEKFKSKMLMSLYFEMKLFWFFISIISYELLSY